MSLSHPLDPLASSADYRHVERFLVLGQERGVYDAPAPDVREVPTPALDRWLAVDGARLARDAAALLASGRVYRPEPALHALARAIVAGPAPARAEALALLPVAVRTSAQLFQAMRYLRGRTPWSGALREAVGAWYATRSPVELARLILQAPADRAWNHREVFRLARPAAPTEAHDALFRWLMEGRLPRGAAGQPGLDLVAAYVHLHETASPLVARGLVERWPGLHEVLPAAWLRDPGVMAGATAGLGADAALRWLRRLATAGVLQADMPAAMALARRLKTVADVPRPFPALAAWAATRFHAATGGTPPPGLVDDLYAAFHAGLAATPRARTRIAVAIDPAASTALDGLPACPGLAPRTALAALAMLAVATGDDVRVSAFGRKPTPLDVAPGDELRAVLARLDGVPGGLVDGAAPIEAAYGGDGGPSTFLVLGGTRPAARASGPEEVLARYHRGGGGPARWIGVSLGLHRLAPRPPAALDTLEIHGYDDVVPALLGDLLRTAGADLAGEVAR